MRTLAKIAFGALVLAMGVLLFVGRRWKEKLSALCENEVLATALAPGGRTRAVLVRRDCGRRDQLLAKVVKFPLRVPAPTGVRTQVSVLRGIDSLPNEPGNVFVIGEDRGRASPPPEKGPVVQVRWLDAGRLQIQYDAQWRVFVADTLVDGIKIRYVKAAAPGARTT